MRTHWLIPLLVLPLATGAHASNGTNVEPGTLLLQLAEPPYQDGDMDYWANQRSAYSDARHLAELGHVKSQYNFAMMAHARGETGTAIHWYKRAAQRKHELAAFNLASIYMEGDGVPQDFGEAARWMEVSAKAGYAPAQFQMGKLYFYGRGVAEDPAMEAYWYRQAAENGHPAAQHNLAVLYHKGEGVERNRELAQEWLKKSREVSDMEDRY